MPPARKKPEPPPPATAIGKARETTKAIVTSMRWELGMLVFVLAYFVVVFATFAFSDQQIARLICTNEVNGWITTECFEGTLAPIDHAFAVIDAIFLTLFLIEIAVKVFALGKGYLQDVLNGADSFIIAISIIMTYLFLAAPDMMNDASSAATLLPFFKIVRLLRVVLVMTRLQRSRERYRRMKMVGLAAPVEKVFEIIGDLRARESTHPEDDKALAWIMDLIAKEELYKANFNDSKHSSGMHLTSEMTDWLRSNLTGGVSAGGLLKGGGGGAAGDKQRSGSVVEDAISGAKKNDAKKGGSEVVEGKVRRTSLLQHTIPPWITKSIGESRCACGEEERPHSHT